MKKLSVLSAIVLVVMTSCIIVPAHGHRGYHHNGGYHDGHRYDNGYYRH